MLSVTGKNVVGLALGLYTLTLTASGDELFNAT
jgi:hypothetical protein